MDSVRRFLYQFQLRLDQFIKHDHRQVYKAIYGTSQFPIFFIIQALWSCFVVAKSAQNRRKNPKQFVKQFVVSFMMTFAPREILAYLLGRLSPIKHNPQTLLIYAAIFLLMNVPFIFKLVKILYYFLGIGQGLNQARIFTFVLNKVSLPVNQLLPIALVAAVSDQIIEIVLRTILNSGEETPLSKNMTVIRTSAFCSIFWIMTNYNQLTQYVGIHPKLLSAVILAFVLGAANSTGFISEYIKQSPENQERHSQETYEEQQRCPTRKNIEIQCDLIK
ncbi:hypothetical protein TRFO_14709 [Tritrichomonas foetus]|uniref:Uncharacterized protein n=1 Tax=Tritrichomonas foetus TaxID=1144522 RepID=A0A1J4KVJ6_9EUKA|nr:hypothetical protein TRFO_14709 [Tritrichomonas foetus]|eukprot:OHT14912.1 hypothetical protein TRFO_14709 [Tritrichomonas foetus]